MIIFWWHNEENWHKVWSLGVMRNMYRQRGWSLFQRTLYVWNRTQRYKQLWDLIWMKSSRKEAGFEGGQMNVSLKIILNIRMSWDRETLNNKLYVSEKGSITILTARGQLTWHWCPKTCDPLALCAPVFSLNFEVYFIWSERYRSWVQFN